MSLVGYLVKSIVGKSFASHPKKMCTLEFTIPSIGHDGEYILRDVYEEKLTGCLSMYLQKSHDNRHNYDWFKSYYAYYMLNWRKHICTVHLSCFFLYSHASQSHKTGTWLQKIQESKYSESLSQFVIINIGAK